MKKLILALMIFAIAAIAPALAFAADVVAAPTEYAIHVQSPLQAIVSLLFGLIGGAIVAGSRLLFGKKGKLPLDDEHSAYLNNAIMTGLTIGETKAKTLIGNIKDPTVQNQLVATAVNFVLASVPTLLVKYDITPVKLRQLILDRLDTKEQTAEAAAPEAPATENADA